MSEKILVLMESLMQKYELKGNPSPTEVEIHDRISTLLGQLENTEQKAVLAVLGRVLDAFEVGKWKLGKPIH